MALNELMQFPGIVPLIAESGVQFLDFGFSVDKTSPFPKEWAFFDAKKQINAGPLPQVVRRGDDEATGQETYIVDRREVFETFDRVWMPLPVFRKELSGGFFRGPVNWARSYLVTLAEPDSDGNAYRLILALDTHLEEFVESEAYGAPSQDDARNGREFALPAHDEPIDWFYREEWVRDWCLEVYKEGIEREERKRRRGFTFRPFTSDELHEKMNGSNDHVARYKAYVDFLHSLGVIPSLLFVDRITEPRSRPIDVDFVLDLGNSRSCGLLIESQPDQLGVDIAQAVKLQLRDLSQPEQVYSEPFSSRFEFARADFGREHLSVRSRSSAFTWPTVVRVGEEAVRLASRRRGTEGASGMSSPKRYLWDEDLRRDSWRFNSPGVADERSDKAMGVAFTTLVNDAGEALHRVPSGPGISLDRLLLSMSAKYSRQNLTSFALAEIFVQALAMINSPMHRLRRPANARLPRRIRRIILTMPTAMPVQERHILEQQANAARDLAYLSMGLASVDKDAEGKTELSYEPDARTAPTVSGGEKDKKTAGPQVLLLWDEATATQAVYLYSQIAINHSGDARTFFDNVRRPANRIDPGTAETLRVATIDIGGGTTDLMVTSLAAEGQGANVTLVPDQLFREGFSLAGDDALLRVVREHVVEPIRVALRDQGLGERADFVLNQLIGADRGGMRADELVRRQQFASQIAAPIALGMLHEYEGYDPLKPTSVSTRSFNDFFQSQLPPSDDLVNHFNREFEKNGAGSFDLRKLQFAIDLPDIDRTVRSVFLEMLQALAEVVWRCRADVLILSGRTSRLPAVRAILQECSALPPHRIVSLHHFRVGQWYPFRDFRGMVGDPKTTAAVGAMVCLLGNGQLHNFNLRSNDFKLTSTARYFGKLDRSGRLLKTDEFYTALDLDDEYYELADNDPFDFRGPMALGFRQVDVEWWPASRLYNLDYSSPEAAGKWNPLTPLKIELSRDKTQSRYGVTDKFFIKGARDRKDAFVKPADLRLRLQTISHQEGYWLDTGVLFGG